MHLDAKTLQEEQGVNILFLALGMLKWFEDKNSDKERFAPLILVPVALDRGNASEKFKLRWLAEDPTPNLSLSALLKRQFGLELPQFVEGDETFAPTTYFERVAQAISSQPRWEVCENDIVLGFFSFAKFLMYRDLDPEIWPDSHGLSEHPIIAGLLGEGFPAGDPLIGEDESVDQHISAEELVHIVDADSSQTLAIHEVRQQRNLVIQGPPGTGKSQTIANAIASAVVDGKRVLFVAEKMAALEVVKRRLDAAGVGDVCLELHSNKANKRSVLEVLRRTWELGRPYGGGDGVVVRQLMQCRDALNTHAARLHQPHSPSGLTPYQVIGHLVRLRQAGQGTPPAQLEAPETWSRHDRQDREFQLRDIASRIDTIGLPSQHPWRGVGISLILPMELERLVARVKALQDRLIAYINDLEWLGTALGTEVANTLATTARPANIGGRVAVAPDLEPTAITANCWASRCDEISDLVMAGEIHAQLRHSLSGTLVDLAWDTDVKAARQHIATHGTSWLRWLNGDYKRASSLLTSLLTEPPPKGLDARIKLLDQLMSAQKAAATLARDEALGREAFGSQWRRERSDWLRLKTVVDWVRGSGDSELVDEIRQIAAGATDRAAIGSCVNRLASAEGKLKEDIGRIFADLKLDLKAAFQETAIDHLSLTALAARLIEWIERSEDLFKWTAYTSKEAQARVAGLGEFVNCLVDGELDAQSVIPAFEMAYYEVLVATMAKTDPELAQFDGDGHSSLVEEFRKLDRKRIALARQEVAAAHHQHMPRPEGGAGPLGILKGEIARRRGHMPIRQLMKRAGPAIQALKPVFMMSPLSVAQFLEPGALEFDLLMVDEASQIQPVDALGAIARCKQVVVVGDDRQLPPTRFFDKVIAGDDSDDDDGAANVGDIESILGLCVSKGLPQRMLRWHYRSRHQSLIAVSNSQFYDNKLFIVPSPYTQQAGMGLRFHHLPHATFDSGNTATNVEEAKAVAKAIIHHAREHPNLSLGVATFSTKQRGAVWDELERLRRLNPDAEGYFTSHPSEPFFIKNLENVQGDERDVIFISVGYGRNPQGYMAMRFGPLSSDGGERRLNVLISRAKRRCEVFSSITDEDIDIERGRGKGVIAFKLFLHFARTGKLGIGQKTDREHDSVFEEQVAKALRDVGYDVHPQVGLAGFFIDLAIADYDKPGRFILGIECDGAPYHSSRSARDRDRLRQAVLEDHGWIIHRIWSTDWFYRPQEQLMKAVAAIEAAKAMLASQDEKASGFSRAVPLEVVTVEREDATLVGLEVAEDSLKLSAPYREASIAVPSQTEIHELPTGMMTNLVRQIVEIEGPVHESEVVARIRSLWGLQRAGNRIQQAVERGIRTAVQEKRLLEMDEFLVVPSGELRVRDRSNVASLTLRKPEMLPPIEIRLAAITFAEAHFGATLEEIVNGVSRLLGFKATSAQLRQIIEAAVGQSVADGGLVQHGDLLKASAKAR
jgi:very-short-patch-repair endonuclease